jgi:hypothetical protein
LKNYHRSEVASGLFAFILARSEQGNAAAARVILDQLEVADFGKVL